MRLFSSPRWTRCLQVSRMALVVSVMLASFQLLAQAQGKDVPWNTVSAMTIASRVNQNAMQLFRLELYRCTYAIAVL